MNAGWARSFRFACVSLFVTSAAMLWWSYLGAFGIIFAVGLNAVVLSWVFRSEDKEHQP